MIFKTTAFKTGEYISLDPYTDTTLTVDEIESLKAIHDFNVKVPLISEDIIASAVWITGKLHIINYSAQPMTLPKGSCIELEPIIDDEGESDNNLSSLNQTNDCENIIRLIAYDKNNKPVGWFTLDTLIECVKKSISLCDLIPDDSAEGVIKADNKLVMVDGECNVSLIKSTDLCCEPKPDVEGMCQ